MVVFMVIYHGTIRKQSPKKQIQNWVDEFIPTTGKKWELTKTCLQPATCNTYQTSIFLRPK